MQFGILGPLEVSDGEHNLTPTAPKLRVALALLVLHANRVVSTETLIGELWGEDPPMSALTTLQTYVYQLRKLLQGRRASADGEILCTRAPGYVARIHSHDIDVCRYESLVEQGRRQFATGDAEAAAHSLRQGLALWRGSALADVSTRPLLQAYVARLEESRTTTIEQRIAADLQLGRHAELVSELRSLTTEHPLDERFYGQLMLALSGAGRRTEALDVYHQLRGTLVRELGLEPSTEIAKLHQAILCDEPAPRPQQPVRETVTLATPGHLPPDTADFTGRAELIERVERLLSPAVAGSSTAPRIAVLTGMPGIGKTALAVHVAHRLRPQHPDGQLHATLRGRDGEPVEPEAVLGRFLRGIGVRSDELPETAEERSQLFRTWSADRQLLVVLDDAVSAAQVQPLLPGGRRCTVLVTSRRRLPGLAGATTVEVAELPVDEATDMLTAVAGRAAQEGRSSAAATIVQCCGRIPLALRAAGIKLAARPHWRMEMFAARLADESRRLIELHADELDLRIGLSEVYAGLTDEDRHTFRLLGLLGADSFTARDAAGILGTAPVNADRLLSQLVDAQLLRVCGETALGEVTYRLAGLVRLYAQERLMFEAPTVPLAVVGVGDAGVRQQVSLRRLRI